MKALWQKMPPLGKWFSMLLTGLAGIPGGLLFYALHIPLPWMLGPLTATLAYQVLSGARARWSVGFRNTAMIVIGYSIGRTVSVETTRQILDNLPAMAAVTLLTMLFCVVTGYITYRQTGVSLPSCILGSMPGGLTQMLLLAEEIKDADLAIVTFMQMTRVLAVICIVPFIATYGMSHLPGIGGYLPMTSSAPASGLVALLPTLLLPPLGAWLAYRLKVPVPYLLGPICVMAIAMLIGYTTPPVPRPLMNTAQFLIGVYLGCAMELGSLRRLGKVLPFAVGGAVALVAFSYLLAFGLTVVTPVTLLTTFLGTAPGGITEMCVVALTLGADVAFVVAFQLFRIIAILVVMSPLLKRQLRQMGS